MKDNLFAVVSFCLHQDTIPKGMAATSLLLIPKVKNAMNTEDYRPIACCNVLYKVVSKILALRLQEFLPIPVDSAQGVFVKGRSITDNVLICH